jgi:aryl-alcohol dehydrogenase-like predicted oxidoreductase
MRIGSEEVKKYLNERGFRILAAPDQVGQKYHVSRARVALGSLVARPSITAPISSATNQDQLNDRVEGVTFELDKASIALLDEASG